jgi:hypothetical protein
LFAQKNFSVPLKASATSRKPLWISPTKLYPSFPWKLCQLCFGQPASPIPIYEISIANGCEEVGILGDARFADVGIAESGRIDSKRALPVSW